MSLRDPRYGHTHCVGSGVPGDVFEHGHDVLPGTEKLLFPTNPDGTGNRYSRWRCFYCQSTRYYRLRENCEQKAAASLRSHLPKIVKRGFAADVAQARVCLERNGVTKGLVADLFRRAIKQPCPGLCCNVLLVDGRVVLDDHVITEWSDLQLDWRNPDFPMTPENIGELCATCNQQKAEMPWPAFIARQRAIRQNLLAATANPRPPEQLGFDF